MLLFLAVAAPLVGLVPLAALAAMLIVVCWTMTEKAELAAIVRARNGETAILAATFLLTVFVNLLAGIAAGIVIAAGLHLYKRKFAA